MSNRTKHILLHSIPCKNGERLGFVKVIKEQETKIFVGFETNNIAISNKNIIKNGSEIKYPEDIAKFITCFND